MPTHLGLSVHFLAPTFHGRRDRDEPEWPPSPLRALQALVAAAGARDRPEILAPRSRAALLWLEQQAPPVILAPTGVAASGYRLSVPNNAMDIVARAWNRGSESTSGDANPATHRTMKTVRPTRLLDGNTVQYLWPLTDPVSDEVRGHIGRLTEIARSVVVLGWGIDMVAASSAIVSEAQAATLPGERWLPQHGAAADGLRVPVPGTLEALLHRHERFLARLGPDGLAAPPPLTQFCAIEYRRATDPPARPVAAFALLKPDTSGFRAFDTAGRALTVAGMLRHAAEGAARDAGWSPSKIDTFVFGHGEAVDGSPHIAVGPRRFAYLPLPSIEARGAGRGRVVGAVRRALVATFAGDFDAEIQWARRALSGRELVREDDGEPVAVLSSVPATEKIVRQYTQPASEWATVTPVVLPGYDDPAHWRRRLKAGVTAAEQHSLLRRLDERIEGLLRKAIIQAGFSQVLADHAELEWRRAGFWPGAEPADRYGVPHHLKRLPRLHVSVRWRDPTGRPVPVPGPICFGGGRFYGLGLFAALSDEWG